MRPLYVLCALLLGMLLAPSLHCQRSPYDELVADFVAALESGDTDGMDRALRRAPRDGIQFFQLTCLARHNGEPEASARSDALVQSWHRVFQDATLLQEIRRWVDSRDNDSLRRYYDARKAMEGCCRAIQAALREKHRPSLEALGDRATDTARRMEESGHLLDASDAWAAVLMVYANLPDASPDERDRAVCAAERFAELRDGWKWTQDAAYPQNLAWLKSERERIAAASAAEFKRASKSGVETLVMPGVEDEVHELEFRMLESMEPDYCARGGPVAPLWWEVLVAEGSAKLAWFSQQPLFLVRLGAIKFGVSTDPGDPSKVFEVGTSRRPKPTRFYLGEGTARPYAMWFFVGGEREQVYHAQLNLEPDVERAPVFYRSASSWTTRIGGETVTFYDDSCDGRLFQKNPYRGGLELHTLGNPEEGSVVPVLDSMRIGRGPRIPYSEFVEIDGSWFHMRGRQEDTKVGVRPLDPTKFETGAVKLAWSGATRAKPTYLVIQGKDLLATAFFQIASGKKVEVPAGDYEICFGRIVSGRGTRVRLANIYRGRSEPFQVRPGAIFELEMGAPFKIEFERAGDDSQVEIEATRIVLCDRSGAVFAGLHNAAVVPDVLAARDASGRGARTFAKFVRMDDPDFVAAAAARWVDLGRSVAMFPAPMGAALGDTRLKARLPFRGALVGLLMRKHPLFGRIESGFR